MRTRARPLDRALLNVTLETGDAATALSDLAAYQNADGGFGCGLEPDISGPASTAIATSIGLRLLARLKAPSGHAMVQGALDWLAANFDWDAGVWPIIGPEVEQAPHAPWWTWSKDMVGSEHVAGARNGFQFNPTAEILGLLYVYRDAANASLIAAAEAGMRTALADITWIESAYDLKCALRLAETEQAPADIARPLRSIVLRSVAAHDAADQHAPVLDFARTPHSLASEAIADRVEQAVATLIDSQQPDGGWSPFWDWSIVDQDAWEKAKADWRGWLTREAVETLIAYGRVEGR